MSVTWRFSTSVSATTRMTDIFFATMSFLLVLELTIQCTVYPKKYAHGFCFAVLCCGYTLTYFPTSIRLTSLALWQSNDCPSASKATLMNMDKYFMWIHYERLHNHNKAKHNKTVCIFLGIYCRYSSYPIKYHTSNGSWRQGIKGEMTCTVYVALVWNIISWIMMLITLFTE